MNKKIWLLILSLCLVLCCTATAMAADVCEIHTPDENGFCTVCGFKVPACIHDWKATKKTDGSAAFYCTKCNKLKYEEAADPDKDQLYDHEADECKKLMANDKGECTVCHKKCNGGDHDYAPKTGTCNNCGWVHENHDYKLDNDPYYHTCTVCKMTVQHIDPAGLIDINKKCTICDVCIHDIDADDKGTGKKWWKNGVCVCCKKECKHESHSEPVNVVNGTELGICDQCDSTTVPHVWGADSKCTVENCGFDHNQFHNPDKASKLGAWTADGKCPVCGWQCLHTSGVNTTTGKCKLCGIAKCDHSWKDGKCTKCEMPHKEIGCTYDLSKENGICTVCGGEHICTTDAKYASFGFKGHRCEVCNVKPTAAEDTDNNGYIDHTVVGLECSACKACIHYVMKPTTTVNYFTNGYCDFCHDPCTHYSYKAKLDEKTGVMNCVCEWCFETTKHVFVNANGTNDYICNNCKYDHRPAHYPESKVWKEGKCTVCGFPCDHKVNPDTKTGKCFCGTIKCPHDKWDGLGICTTCKFQCVDHKYSNGKCSICGWIHDVHVPTSEHYDKDANNTSYVKNDDLWEDGKCKVCGFRHPCADTKDWNDKLESGVSQCNICEYVCTHDMEDGKCVLCGRACYDHRMKKWQVEIEISSCDKHYWYKYKCDACGLVKDVYTLGHEFAMTFVEATCVKPADFNYYCVKCNKKATADDIKLLMLPAVNLEDLLKEDTVKYEEVIKGTLKDHTWKIDEQYRDSNGKLVYKAPTCTSEGWGYAYCSYCTGKYTNGVAGAERKLPKLNHELKEDQKLPASCFDDQRIADVCTKCGGEFEVELVQNGEKAPGQHRIGSYVEVKSTCMKAGEEYFICERCNAKFYDAFVKNSPAKPIAINKDAHHFVESRVLVDGDCFNNRVVLMVCDNVDTIGNTCGEAKIVSSDNNHKYVPGVDYKPATCGTDATGTMICSVCSNVKVLKAGDEPATGNHNYKIGTIKPANCTDPAKEGFFCTVCFKLKQGAPEAVKVDGSDKLGHDWHKILDKVDATGALIYREEKCDLYGKVYADKCNRCGKTPEEAGVDTDGLHVLKVYKKHADAVYDYVAPTCTAKAAYAEICPVCKTIVGKVNPIAESEPLKHDLKVETHPATCKEAGYTIKACQRKGCGYTEGKVIIEAINLKNHVPYDVKELRLATCTKAGIKLQLCKLCGGNAKLVLIPAHHTWDKGTIITPATCGTKGKVAQTCTVCGEKKDNDIAATGQHVYNGKTTIPETCLSVSKYGTFCTVCGNNMNGDAVDVGTTKGAHKWVELPEKEDKGGNKIAVEPTCTTAGRHYEECSVCKLGKVVNEVAKGHVYGDLQTNDTGTVSYRTCTVCGEPMIVDGKEEGNACATYGHKTEVLAASEPTCTLTGLTAGKKCTVCGTILEAQKVIAALGHTEESVPAKAATCIADGLTEGKKCSVCGVTIVEQEVVKALGHKYTKKFSFNEDCTKRVVTFTCGTCGDTYSTEEDF